MFCYHKHLWYIIIQSMVFEKIRAARKQHAENDYIVGLDIGTEFVKALIAKVNDDSLEIVGVGRSRQEVSDMHSGAIADISGRARPTPTISKESSFTLAISA